MRKRVIESKRGSMSLYIVLLMLAILPLIMLGGAAYVHWTVERVQLKAVTDNAAASAILQINRDELAKGNIVINETEARTAALNVLKSSLKLTDTLEAIGENHPLVEAPILDIQILNTVPEGKKLTVDEKVIAIENPSVIIDAVYKVKGAMALDTVDLHIISVSQAEFKNTPYN